MLRTLWQDLRYGLRMMAKTPGFTTIAILTIALGVGANAAIFSLIEGVLLRNLPVRDAEQLVLISSGDLEGSRSFSFSYPMYVDLRDRSEVLSGVIARSGASMNVAYAGGNERVRGELVSGNYFTVLGVRPWLGRLITEEDDQKPGAAPVAVLSYNFWQRRFGKDPSIVDKTVILNDHAMTVIGIAPPGFYGTDLSNSPDVQVPLMMTPVFVPLPANRLQSRQHQWLTLMGRRKPGVSLAQAQVSMGVLFHQIRESEAPRLLPGVSSFDREKFLSTQLAVTEGGQGFLRLQREMGRPLWLLLGVTTIVLLILTANLANMLLARNVERRQEIAVRLTLGASRMRLMQQWLSESLLLSLAGGTAGILVALWSKDALIGFLPSDLQKNLNQPLDMRVFGFAFAVSVALGLLLGLAPGFRASRFSLADAIKGTGPTIVAGGNLFSLRSGLIVLQVALCLPLLIGAGLFLHSLENLQGLDTGFAKNNVLLATLDPGLNGYSADRIRNLYTEVLERTRTIPGVVSASLATYSPISRSWDQEGVVVEGYQPRDGESMSPNAAAVSTDYFRTLGIPVTAGRDFTERDQAAAPKVAIINETMAHYFFGEKSPLGKKFTTDDTPGKLPDIEIVGVVKDAKYTDLKEETPRHFYIPIAQVPRLFDLILHVKTATEPSKIADLVRGEVRSVDPNLPLYDVKSLQAQIDESLTQERLVSWLTSLFGLIATILAAIGLYGVVAFSVVRRTREIGIRIALGANRGNVLWLVIRQMLAVVGVGTALGIAFALAATRVLQGMLYELKPRDPWAFSTAAFVLCAVATLAAYLPARRATRIDPMIALRYE